MKKRRLLACFISILCFGCYQESGTGSVFDDHAGVPYNDGSGLTDIMDGKSHYFGNLHSHTAYSDGEGTPDEAFSWARDIARYDFYAITDHAELLTAAQWDDTGKQADFYTQDGTFLAIRGFEWSHLTGHICVYNTDAYTSSLLSISLSTFADWLDDHNGYAQFNHPDRELNMFHNFRYDGRITDNMVLIETGNKGRGNISGEYLQHYATALAKGWRLAPADNQDNHSLTTNSHRTVIIADDLTIPDVFSALENRRVYASDDPDMRVVFKVGAHWMGEVVNIQSGSYEFIVQVEDDEPTTQLEIIDSTGATIKKLSTVSYDIEWYPVLSVTTDNYYFLKVTQSDTNGDEPSYQSQIAVTAPIWLNIQ